jgi:DNA-binding PucR family transcriptional regulator
MDGVDHLPEQLLARSPQVAERLRQAVLGPLEDHEPRSRADLLGTLETFVACDRDRQRAAKRLRVHPNTLDYRLRRIQGITGLNLASSFDLVLVSLALMQRGAKLA